MFFHFRVAFLAFFPERVLEWLLVVLQAVLYCLQHLRAYLRMMLFLLEENRVLEWLAPRRRCESSDETVDFHLLRHLSITGWQYAPQDQSPQRYIPMVL